MVQDYGEAASRAGEAENEYSCVVLEQTSRNEH